MQAAAHSILTNYEDDIAAAINCDVGFGKGVCVRADAFFVFLIKLGSRSDCKCCKRKTFPRLLSRPFLITASSIPPQV